MNRIVGINKIDKLKEKYRRLIVKSYTGELLPDFREQGGGGFDVTDWSNIEYLENNSDIPKMLYIINRYCPVAHISSIMNMGTQMSIEFGDIDLHIELRHNKIVSIRVLRVCGSNRTPINIFYENNDIEKVFQNKVVKNNIEYAILRKELLLQYQI